MAGAGAFTLGVELAVPRDPRTNLPSPERCASALQARYDQQSPLALSLGRSSDRWSSPDAAVLTQREHSLIQELVTQGDNTTQQAGVPQQERSYTAQYHDTHLPRQLEASSDDEVLSDEAYYHRLLELKQKNLETLQAVERLCQKHVWRRQQQHPIPGGTQQQSRPVQKAWEAGNDAAPTGSGALAGDDDDVSNQKAESDNTLGSPVSSFGSGTSDLGAYCPSNGDNRSSQTSPGVTLDAANDADGEFEPDSEDMDDREQPGVVEVDGFSAVQEDLISVTLSESTGQSLRDDAQHSDLPMYSSSDESDSSEYQSSASSGLRHKDLIDSMWNDFTVERTALTGSARQRSAWSPAFTIPEPFEMTLREEKRKRLRRPPSRCIQEAVAQQRQREQAELEATQQTFRAKDVPAFVKKPKYNAMRYAEEEKRKQLRKEFAEKLLSEQKPFSFIERERQRKEKLRESVAQRSTKPVGIFRAKPLPVHMHDPAVKERILEEELYRQIRTRMRADRTLASSRLPSSMETRQRSLSYTLGHLRQDKRLHNESNAFLTRHHRFQPCINPGVPDFGELHRRLQQQKNSSVDRPYSTQVEPFFLRTQVIAELRQQKKDRQEGPHVVVERPGQAPPSTTYVKMADAADTRATRSSQLRANAARSKIHRREEQLFAQESKQHSAEHRERGIRDRLSKSMNETDNSVALEMDSYRKIREHKKAQRARDQQYQSDLKEMERRLSERPLLVDRVAESNARLAVEHNFSKTLKNAGVRMDDLDTSLSASPGVDTTASAGQLDDSLETVDSLSD